MRLEQLQYLLEIDKYQSISAAAQKLYVGQTTLSAIVKNIEKELGFTIFERTHNGVRRTPEGEEALSIIKEIVCRYKDIQKLSSQNDVLSAPISVITSPTVNSALAIPLNERFLQKVPNGNINFYAVLGEEVGSHIIKNDSNIGVTYFRRRDLENFRIVSKRYNIKTDILLSDHLYFLVSQDNPLARNTVINPNMLENQQFAILPHFGSAEEGTSYYLALFASGNHYTTLTAIGLIKQAVIAHNMVSILTGYAIFQNNSVDNSLLKAIPIIEKKDKNDLLLCLIYRAENNLSYQERILLQCVREYFQHLKH